MPGGREGKYDPEYSREAWLCKKYGITASQYDQILAEQGGVCAICGKEESAIQKNGKVKRLSVDHCHDSKKVRGLLCTNCNRAIGYFQDSIENLQRAIAYLKRDKTTLAGQGQVRLARSLELAGVDGE